MKKRRKVRKSFILAVLALFIALTWFFLDRYNLIPHKTYTAEHFGIETAVSPVDFNGNGIDDYRDILLGARKDAANKPRYDSSYYGNGGYPPDDVGVCTDVVWRAFREAGYCLRDMVNNDIRNYPEAYPGITTRDGNIDFRRVGNLQVFFARYCEELTADTGRIEEFMPGDIVIFGANKHIGIVSDQRNSKGVPYIIHNAGQPNREEDFLKRSAVTHHYRWDASKIDLAVLVPWN